MKQKNTYERVNSNNRNVNKNRNVGTNNRRRSNKSRRRFGVLRGTAFFSVLIILAILTAVFCVHKIYLRNNSDQNASVYASVDVNTNELDSSASDAESNSGDAAEEDTKTDNIAPVTPNAGSEKIAYLTFDDGPSDIVTPQILDILKSYNIKATFFVLGQNAELYPEILQRIYNEGHKIANHSYSHNYKHIYSSVETLLNEIYTTNDIIDQSLGFKYGNTIFRFPGGSFEKADCFKTSVKEMGFKYVDWNCLGNDAVSGSKTADEIFDATVNTSVGKNTLTILFHDTNAKQTTADALPRVIEYFIEQGYEFKVIENI